MRMVCVSLLFLMICGFFSLQSSETAVLFFFFPKVKSSNRESQADLHALHKPNYHYHSFYTAVFLFVCFCEETQQNFPLIMICL